MRDLSGFGLPLAVLLVLGGCAGLKGEAKKPLVNPPASSDEALGIADDLAQRGRWSAALDMLDSAAQEFPDDPAVAKRQQEMQARWQRQEREFEDQLMVGFTKVRAATKGEVSLVCAHNYLGYRETFADAFGEFITSAEYR